MHFIHDRDALMQAYNLNRKLATLAIRFIKGIDNIEIISACDGFHNIPLLVREEWIKIKDVIKERLE